MEYKSQDVRSVDLFFISGSGQHKSKEQLPNTNGAWRKEIFTFTTGNNPNQRGNIRIDNNGSALGNVTSKLWTRFIKLEKGNKPTDWSPAPEDIENKVANIQTDLQVAINNASAYSR